MQLKIKIVDSNAKGLYKTDLSEKDDSGLDLYVLQDIHIKVGQTIFIDFGIQCEMINSNKNVGYYLYPRSSISKTPLIMANSVGIIDSGYRGNIKAAIKYIPNEDFFQNYTNKEEYKEYIIKKGTRLFQICSCNLQPFTTKVVDTLTSSERGSGGFGSTGTGIQNIGEPKNISEMVENEFCGFNS